MTNLEIVIGEAINQGVFTEEQIQGYLSEGDLPLKTFKSWQDAGYTVRKGQKARLQTKLWQLRNKKKKETEDSKDEVKNDTFILVPAYLFTLDQVAKIGEDNGK